MMEGIGIDVVDISRMERLSEKTIGRLFHTREVEQAFSFIGKRRSEFLAGRYAAKEAFGKALGTGLVGFRPSELLVENDEHGRPVLVPFGNAATLLAGRTVLLSISHDGPVAVAVVLLQGAL